MASHLLLNSLWILSFFSIDINKITINQKNIKMSQSTHNSDTMTEYWTGEKLFSCTIMNWRKAIFLGHLVVVLLHACDWLRCVCQGGYRCGWWSVRKYWSLVHSVAYYLFNKAIYKPTLELILGRNYFRECNRTNNTVKQVI